MIQAIGFSFIILGNITYNEILEWKMLGLNKKMRKYINVDVRKSKNSKVSDEHGLIHMGSVSSNENSQQLGFQRNRTPKSNKAKANMEDTDVFKTELKHNKSLINTEVFKNNPEDM